MIKSVLFDWVNTLAQLHPERHELYARFLSEFGFQSSTRDIMRAINSTELKLPTGSPYRWHKADDAEDFIQYQEMVLCQLGFELSQDTILEYINVENRELRKATYTLYDDVLPVLGILKERSIITGLISNLNRDMDPICQKFGLSPYITFTVTSREVGVEKPEPPIFIAGLERAGVDASEAIYVGDQYQNDVIGARGVGINAILLDRHDINYDITDCPRIKSLAELIEYL